MKEATQEDPGLDRLPGRSPARSAGRRHTVLAGAPRRMKIDLDRAGKELVGLVLTVVELLRQLLLKQAVRRMEGGFLRDDEVERLGVAMMRMEETMEMLRGHFGLTDEDLNLDLGPLGKLL